MIYPTTGLVDLDHSRAAARFGQPDVIKFDIQGRESAVIGEGWDVVSRCRCVLIELSDLDPERDAVERRLVDEFGPATIVNQVFRGFDVAFERSLLTN